MLWIVSIISLLASGLTFFSGFGLGTLLMPALALTTPLPVAIAITALVHLANNIYKFILIGKHTDYKTAFKFGIPAILSAFVGAYFLNLIGESKPWLTYSFLGKESIVTPLKICIGILILGFAAFEILSLLKQFKLSEKHLPLGGALSGFFGGLSGHQGALRSAFLIHANLTKESFVATGTVIAMCVDISRLIMYSALFIPAFKQEYSALIITATLSAWIGATLGRVFLKKTTFSFIQRLVAGLLTLVAFLLIFGII